MSSLGVREGSQVISSVLLVTLNELTSPGTRKENSSYTHIHAVGGCFFFSLFVFFCFFLGGGGGGGWRLMTD